MTSCRRRPLTHSWPHSTTSGRSYGPLQTLAAAEDRLRRRTAVTAPLWFVRRGDDAQFAEVFSLAAVLVAGPGPVVHKAVGIALKHAGARDPRAVVEFLEKHAEATARAALHSAVDKLAPHDRARFTPERSRRPRTDESRTPGPSDAETRYPRKSGRRP